MLVPLIALPAFMGSAQVYMTKDEALKRFFPAASAVERKTLFLTDSQTKEVEALAKSRLESKVITYYTGRRGNDLLGYAFFETHVVRTMPATVLIMLTPAGQVERVEILAFYEPEDYLPPKRWLELFRARALDDNLWVKRGIQGISGATLSAQAITAGVRRFLAMFRVALAKEVSQ